MTSRKIISQADSPALSSVRCPRRRARSEHSWSRTGQRRRRSMPARTPGPRARRRSGETFRYGLFGSRGASVSFIDQLSRVTFGAKVSVPYLYGSFVILYLVAHHHTRVSLPRGIQIREMRLRLVHRRAWTTNSRDADDPRKDIGRVYLLIFMP